MWKRLLTHLCTTRWQLRNAFTPAIVEDIERAIRASERQHAGELRVALEAALGLDDLLTGVTPRARALEVFNELHMWDTEQDNGVLIYVLFADHALEIVADRGFNAHVDDATWRELCERATREFHAGRYGPGLARLVEEVGALVARHYPPRPDDLNELPDSALFL